MPFSGRHSAAAERLWLPTALALLFHGTAPQGSVQAEAAVVRPSTTEQHLESTSDTKANKTAKKQKRKNLGGILGESIDNTATNVNVTKDISPDEIVDAEIVSLQPREEKGEGEAGGEREGVEEGSRGRGGGDLSKETGHGEGKGTGIAKADGPSTVQERLQTRFKRKRQQRQMGRGDDNTDADDNETASESGDKNAIDGGLRSRDQNDRDDGAKSKSGRQIVDDENQGPVGALGALVERREIDEHEDVRQEPTECVATGPCVWCAASEMEVEYCKETGRRQEVRCTGEFRDASSAALAVATEGARDGGNGGGGAPMEAMAVLPSSVRYRSCLHAEEDDVRGLLYFWLMMLALGSAACFGIRRRQQRGGSLYDRRAK